MKQLDNKNIIIGCLILLISFEKKQLIIDFIEKNNNLIYCFCIILTYLLYKNFRKINPKKDHEWIIMELNEQFKLIRKKLPILKLKTTLIIGLDNIGKQSILMNNYKQLNIRKHQKISISWWYKNNHLICCAAPRINKNQTAQYSTIIWQIICKKMLLLRLQKPFDQILITLHIPALHKPHEAHQARDIDQINTSLATILKYNKNSKCKIIFTQADFIKGFQENFANLNKSEHEKSWSIIFNTNLNHIVSNDFDKKFDLWLNKICNDIYYKLQINSNTNNKSHIIEFPLQLEKLKTPIKKLLKQLYLPENQTVESVSFCSNIQNNIVFDYITNTFIKNNNKTLSTPIFCKKLVDNNFKSAQINYTKLFLIFMMAIMIITATTKKQVALSKLTNINISSNNLLWKNFNHIETNINVIDNLDIFSKYFNSEIKQKRQHLNSLYFKHLQEFIAPEVKANLLQQLKTKNDYLQQFEALSIYKILIQKQLDNKNLNYFSKWLNKKTNHTISNKAINDLLQYIHLNNKDKQLINKTEILINKLPKNKLVILQAVSEFNEKIQIPGSISFMQSAYDYQNFNTINNKIIPNLCNKDVFCIDSSKKEYLQLYLDFWNNLLHNPNKITISSSDINSQTKSYTTLLNYISKNMAILNQNPTQYIKNLNNQWQQVINNMRMEDFSTLDLINFINQNKASDHQEISNNLQKIWSAYFSSIIAENAQTIIINDIQNIWSNNILTSYHDIKNKYPLNQTAQQDLSLNDFNNFFAIDSETNIFIDTYITPLCNIENSKYSNLKNPIIKFNKNFLDQITLYKWIQQMFFTGNKLAIRANLIPQKINSDINQIKLMIDNQTIKLLSGKEPAITINWPFIKEETMSFIIVDSTNRSHIQSNHGPWALFKTISQAALTHSNNSNEFNLSFNIENFNLKYKLVTENIINPFTFDIFNAFKLNNIILEN